MTPEEVTQKLKAVAPFVQYVPKLFEGAGHEERANWRVWYLGTDARGPGASKVAVAIRDYFGLDDVDWVDVVAQCEEGMAAPAGPGPNASPFNGPDPVKVLW